MILGHCMWSSVQLCLFFLTMFSSGYTPTFWSLQPWLYPTKRFLAPLQIPLANKVGMLSYRAHRFLSLCFRLVLVTASSETNQQPLTLHYTAHDPGRPVTKMSHSCFTEGSQVCLFGFAWGLAFSASVAVGVYAPMAWRPSKKNAFILSSPSPTLTTVLAWKKKRSAHPAANGSVNSVGPSSGT